MVKYSVVFCYRNRAEHLAITVPQIRKVLEEQGEVEMIVIEQDDDQPFRRGNLLNEGAKLATGDIIILHDADYYPANNTVYFDGNVDVFLPIKQVEFVKNDLTIRPLEEVPSGYRKFKDSVDDNFFGGVISFKRDAFFKCGGYSPLYKGWGLEDQDLRERINEHHLTTARGTGKFLALEHADSAPVKSDINFQNNMRIFALWKNFLQYGARSQICSKEFITSPQLGVDKWMKVKNFDILTGADKR